METVRGCTENCSYCEVIQQFLGYRMVAREVEWKRLEQLQRMAADGLIMAAPDGRFAVFVTDDLHPPPRRAVKFRNERMERINGWKGRTDGMYLVCQTRTELAEDPEMCEGLRGLGMEMLYLGVESNSAENLKAVNKRQEPGQVDRNLRSLQNEWGFTNVAMTIIGLPYDTDEKIMDMADWAKEVSKYQTANLLTPLPATENWDLLQPLAEDGSLLKEGEMRPYHVYNGKRLVHFDKRWTMQESEELYKQYTARLRPVDRLYERIFQQIRRKAEKGGAAVPQKVLTAPQ